jgi:hypothetical protein
VGPRGGDRVRGEARGGREFRGGVSAPPTVPAHG